MMLQSRPSPFSHLADAAAAVVTRKPAPLIIEASPDSADLAAQIVLAGRKRRGEVEVTAAPPQPKGIACTAAQIVAAAAKARNEGRPGLDLSRDFKNKNGISLRRPEIVNSSPFDPSRPARRNFDSPSFWERDGPEEGSLPRIDDAGRAG
jgi:hypothetical protein